MLHIIKLYSQSPFPLRMGLRWPFCSVINVRKWFKIPQKLICLLKKELQAWQARRAAQDHWQPFMSREKGSWASQLLAGWLVTCGWHICIFKDAHRQTQYVWECLCAMWKNPTPSSEEVSSPSQTLYHVLRSFICRAVASAASCKQVAWTGCTENSWYVLCSPVCSAPNRKRSCRKLQIRSHYTTTNMTGTVLRIIWAHSLSVSSNEHEQCKLSVYCAAEHETVPLNWG